MKLCTSTTSFIYSRQLLILLLNWYYCTIMKLYSSLLLLAASASAQSVTCDLRPQYAAPVMADGWESRLIATGLNRPRSIVFDSEGSLLVVEQRGGIKHMRLADGNGSCLSVESQTDLVNDTTVSLLALYLLILIEVAQSRPCSISRWKNTLRIFSRRSLRLDI